MKYNPYALTMQPSPSLRREKHGGRFQQNPQNRLELKAYPSNDISN